MGAGGTRLGRGARGVYGAREGGVTAAVRGGFAAPGISRTWTQGSAHRPRVASSDRLHPGLLNCGRPSRACGGGEEGAGIERAPELLQGSRGSLSVSVVGSKLTCIRRRRGQRPARICRAQIEKDRKRRRSRSIGFQPLQSAISPRSMRRRRRPAPLRAPGDRRKARRPRSGRRRIPCRSPCRCRPGSAGP